MGREGTLAPPGGGTLATPGSSLKDADGLQPEDGMQEEANSLSKFSSFSHTGERGSGGVEAGLFGRLVDQKPQIACLGDPRYSSQASSSGRNSSVKTAGLAPGCKSSWTYTGKAERPGGKSCGPAPAGRQVDLGWRLVCPGRAGATEP